MLKNVGLNLETPAFYVHRQRLYYFSPGAHPGGGGGGAGPEAVHNMFHFKKLYYKNHAITVI
jgi:hypothetical protein